MWYGVMVTLAMIVAVAIICRRAKKHNLTSDKVIDYMIFCIPAGLIGARLYYVLFNFQEFAAEPMRIFNTRAGGLAVHGGLLLGIAVALLLCRLWNVNLLNALDLAAPGIALAQAIGRWGNYFNEEAHGGPTDLPWGTLIDGVKVHPTFLYESIWCFLLFLLLLRIDDNRGFRGQTFLLYAMLYSVERFFVEQLRTDSLMLLGIFRQAQVMSALVFVACLIAYLYLRRRERSGSYLYY
jgi:phosphatidylglycerol:prolipoprotein diacylglycerol transferase